MKESIFKAPKRPEKISDQIIAQIRDIILAGDLKPGDKLGSEKELISQFGVSKGTLREALRVLEAMGLVEIRKGLSGGVFIAEVDMKTTIHSIINFLHFKAVSIKDITMLRFFVEPFIVRLAAANITEEDINKLKAMISNEIGEPRNNANKGEIKKGISFHRYLARLTHNPILILIMDFVDNLLTDMKSQLDLGDEFYKKVKTSHRRVLECLSSGDADGAEKEIILDLLTVGKAMAEMSGTPEFDPATLGLGLDILQTGKGGNGYQPMISRLTNHLPKIMEKEGISGEVSNGVILKHVGSGDLYMMVLKDKNKSNPTSSAK